MERAGDGFPEEAQKAVWNHILKEEGQPPIPPARVLFFTLSPNKRDGGPDV